MTACARWGNQSTHLGALLRPRYRGRVDPDRPSGGQITLDRPRIRGKDRGLQLTVRLSVIIPAYNEERCLPETLRHIAGALSRLHQPSEVIVVDNHSDDRTRDVAEGFGARVVSHAEHNISAVRNAGAKVAIGDLLVFIDADTWVPDSLFESIAAAMRDDRCLGGAVSVQIPAARPSVDEAVSRGRAEGNAYRTSCKRSAASNQQNSSVHV